MEVRILLILLSCIVIVLGIAFYLSSRQNQELKKKLIKQEPQLNYTPNTLADIKDNIRFDQEINHQEEEIEEVFWQDQDNDNLLLSDSTPTNPTVLRDTSVKTPMSFQAEQPKAEPQRPLPKQLLNAEIIYLMVLAPKECPHTGYELLQSLLAAGLRYGPMNIFHRFEDANGRGKILFSVASIEEPGTFEINKMGAYSGKGLMMFLRFSSGKDLSTVFEIMLETAKQLVEDLGGQIFDDEKQILNNDKIEKMRKKIADFEQKQLIPDLFEI